MKTYKPTALVKLTRGFVTIVDEEDLPWISKTKWCISNPTMTPYATRGFEINGKCHMSRLHTEVWERHNGRKLFRRHEVHHENGNSLDNRSANLVEVTRSKNNALRKIPKKNKKSGLPVGVFYCKCKSKPYKAQISDNGKVIHVGIFRTPQEAKRAFDAEWSRIYGYLNR